MHSRSHKGRAAFYTFDNNNIRVNGLMIFRRRRGQTKLAQQKKKVHARLCNRGACNFTRQFAHSSIDICWRGKLFECHANFSIWKCFNLEWSLVKYCGIWRRFTDVFLAVYFIEIRNDATGLSSPARIEDLYEGNETYFIPCAIVEISAVKF